MKTQHLRRLLRRLGKWSLYSFLTLTGLVSLAMLGIYLWLRTGLPDIDGEATVKGLSAPVEIYRDDHGLITIRAARASDAYRALGYAHAQDRLFQMDMMRRVGAGRLSEVIGEATLPYDRLMRTLGLYRLAEANYGALPTDIQHALDAYAAGVNAYLESHAGAWPPEFYLLGYRPELWRAADSLVWGRLMAWQLSGNAYAEAATARALSGLQGDANDPVRNLIDPKFAAVMPSIWPGGQRNAASNNWVVSGKLAESGYPILANDPHLGLDRPPVWYLVRIEIADENRTLLGVTAPGTPFLIIGQNDDVAWGFTTTHSDTQDLFVENVSADGQRYDYASSGPQREFDIRTETIAVKGQAPVTLTIRTSVHGPVVSDLPAFSGAPAGQVWTLSWPGLDPGDQTAAALFQLNRAKNASEVRQALASFETPQQNIVYADRDGHIGFVAAGKVPLRAQHQHGGLLGGTQASGVWRAAGPYYDSTRPVPGWGGYYDWAGSIPYDLLPQEADPASGWIATANNKITDEFYPYFLGVGFDAPYRYQRIAETLQATRNATLQDMATLQNDTLSTLARSLTPRLVTALSAEPSPPVQKAAAILRQWDYRIDRHSPAALIFNSWLRNLGMKWPGDNRDGSVEIDRLMEFLDRNLNAHGEWTGSAQDREMITQSLAETLASLTKSHGSDMMQWRWGQAHRAALNHQIWSRIPILGDWLNASLETGGDNFTINRGTYGMAQGETAFPHVHGAGLRMIADLSNPDHSLFMIAGGQSGHVLSAHFGDLGTLWRDGQYLTMVGGGIHLLRLLP